MTAPIPFDDYCAIPACNFSTLKFMAQSPLHYRAALESRSKPSAAQVFGSAVHCALLEPDRFPLAYTVWTGVGDRRSKAYKEFAAVEGGRIILMAGEYATVLACRDAVLANEWAAPLLKGSRTEQTLEWTDAAIGIACKARLDAITAGGIVVDLKTAGSVDAHDFERSAGTFLYHAQLAFYQRGADATWPDHERPMIAPNPVIIAVESSAPHDVAVMRLSDAALGAGDAMVSEWLERLAICRESDVWPGRYAGVQELSVPSWMLGADVTDDGWANLPERSVEA